MPETTTAQEEQTDNRTSLRSRVLRQSSSTSFRELWLKVLRNLRMFLTTVGALLFACLLYCLAAPNVYEATARVALQGTSASALALDRNEGAASGSFASGQVQLETLANVFRSDRLAWDVISHLKLYQAPGFITFFGRQFTNLNPSQPDPQTRAYLLDDFQRELSVETIPRTLVLQIHFRSHDAALSAMVVNALIEAYHRQDADVRMQATKDATTVERATLIDSAPGVR